MNFWGIISVIVTSIVGILGVLSYFYSMRHARKMKELDLEDNEKNRIFQIQRIVTLKCMEVMIEIVFRLNQRREKFESYITKGIDKESIKQMEEDPIDKELIKQMEEDSNYIKLNLPYSPVELREEILNVLTTLTALTKNYKNAPNPANMLLNISTIIEKINNLVGELTEKYNLFNEQSTKR